MARDVQAVTGACGGEIFILLFDDENRDRLIDDVETWSIDPEVALTHDEGTRLIGQVRAAPVFENSESPPVPYRGNLGALDNA